jgi:hypothetical protein
MSSPIRLRSSPGREAFQPFPNRLSAGLSPVKDGPDAFALRVGLGSFFAMGLLADICHNLLYRIRYTACLFFAAWGAWGSDSNPPGLGPLALIRNVRARKEGFRLRCDEASRKALWRVQWSGVYQELMHRHAAASADLLPNATNEDGRPTAMCLKEMVGTRRLERLTSTVSIWPGQVLNDLLKSRDCQSSRKSYKTSIFVGCGLGVCLPRHQEDQLFTWWVIRTCASVR